MGHPPSDQPNNDLAIVVVGAHLAGLPLNRDLVTRGARLVVATRTSKSYRLYALAAKPGAVPKPGLKRVVHRDTEEEGACIHVEVWNLPAANVASFLTTIAHPLGIGSIELEDGTWKHGFICEPAGLHGALDITEFGGWRMYLKSREEQG